MVINRGEFHSTYPSPSHLYVEGVTPCCDADVRPMVGSIVWVPFMTTLAGATQAPRSSPNRRRPVPGTIGARFVLLPRVREGRHGTNFLDICLQLSSAPALRLPVGIGAAGIGHATLPALVGSTSPTINV